MKTPFLPLFSARIVSHFDWNFIEHLFKTLTLNAKYTACIFIVILCLYNVNVFWMTVYNTCLLIAEEIPENISDLQSRMQLETIYLSHCVFSSNLGCHTECGRDHIPILTLLLQ